MTKYLTGKYFLTTFFAFAFFFFLFSFANAATYYISPTGSDSNSGTEAQPFKNIQKAADIVNPGDTVIVKDGIYTDTNSDGRVVDLRRGGTPGNWITFKSENKWGAKIDGELNSTGYGFIFGAAVGYLRFEDFEVTEFAYVGFQSNLAGISNVYYYRNHIHHIGLRTPSTQWEMDNYLYGRTGIYQGPYAPDQTTSFTYDSNVIHHIGRLDDPDNWHSNRVPPYPQTEEYKHDHGIYLTGSDVTIINNVFYEQNHGFHVKISPGSSNVKVVNNTFDTPNQGVLDGGNSSLGGRINIWGKSSANVDNVFIENNIFEDPGFDYLIWTWPLDGNYITNVIVRNNLTTASKILSPNITKNGFTLSNNTVSQTAQFIDKSNNNFHLQLTSLAINAGISTNAPSYDFDGNTRPQGSAYDIGAYEYISESTTPPTCTFTYSNWQPSTCPSNQTQTRTVTSSSPSGCTGGTPALTQSCVYTPPPTTASLANNTTMTSNSQNFASDHQVEHLWDGCIDGTPTCTTGSGSIPSFWIEFDFTQNYDLTQARLYGDDMGSWWSKDWTLKYRQNVTEEWQTAFNNVNAFLNDWSIQNLNNTTARYIRVEVNGNPDRPATQARELEIYGTPSSAQPPPTLKGDLDKNGAVNTLDWSIMNSKWNTADATADLNNDGIVNSIDFSILNGGWGA